MNGWVITRFTRCEFMNPPNVVSVSVSNYELDKQKLLLLISRNHMFVQTFLEWHNWVCCNDILVVDSMHLLQPDWKISAAGPVDWLFEDLFTLSTKLNCFTQKLQASHWTPLSLVLTMVLQSPHFLEGTLVDVCCCPATCCASWGVLLHLTLSVLVGHLTSVQSRQHEVGWSVFYHTIILLEWARTHRRPFAPRHDIYSK